MVGWHHLLNGHEFEQDPRDGEGQGSLVCCSPWGRKESDTTEQLNSNKIYKTKNIYTTQCSPLCEEVLRSFTFFHVLLLCSFHLFKLNIIYFYNYAKAINAV